MGKEVEFLEACKEGNVVKVEHLLTLAKSKKYIVPLFSKTASGLLQSRDPQGSTALHLAASNGRKAVVFLLLDEGADVTAVDENGCLALHFACSSGYLDIASALISHDQRQETINAVTKSHDSPLHFAAQYGHSNVASLLIRNGAMTSSRNSKGETPLDLASKLGRVEVVRCLLETNPNLVLNALIIDPKNADAQLPPPFSPLHLAAKNGKIDVVRVLLDAGFDIDFFTEDGTALHVASLHGKIDIVKLLLERGIKPDTRDFQGRTALELLEEHQAGKGAVLSHLLPNASAWQHCSSLITDYIERGSEASTVSKEVATIYMNAIRNQRTEDTSSTPTTTDPIWLPIPSNSQERINFEQGIIRCRAENTDNITAPLSVVTNFQAPSSTEDGSICSTISLTTDSPSPSNTIITTSSLSRMSPRFPCGTNAITINKEASSRTPPVKSGRSKCTYQPMPLQYDNVPAPGLFPRTTYDNVPTNEIGYDNAPPPNVHAWSHCCQPNTDIIHSPGGQACCGDDGKENSGAGLKENQIGKERQTGQDDYHTSLKDDHTSVKENQTDQVDKQHEVTVKTHQLDHVSMERRGERVENGVNLTPRAIGGASVKFVDAPPETLYLPVEAKLYTRMTQPFSTCAPVSPPRPVSQALTMDEANGNVVHGPYDNVPVARKENHAQQKKSPDFDPLEVDQDLNSMQLIDQTIQAIEQSSRDLEENVEIRSPSRSSQLSAGTRMNNGSMTPPGLNKAKIPPPVSPKPKLIFTAGAPLALPESDDLLASTDSGECVATWPSNVTHSVSASPVHRESRCGRSSSRHRSLSRHRQCKETTLTTLMDGNTIVQTASPVGKRCVDRAAQVDAGTGSSERDSICSRCKGSQCSLISSTSGSGSNRISPTADETIGRKNAAAFPDDEQAEWKQIDAIFESCGTRMARLSVFDREIQPQFSNYLNGGRKTDVPKTTPLSQSTIHGEHDTDTIGSVEQWLISINMEKYKEALLSNGFDRLEYLTVTLNEIVLRSIGVSSLEDIETILFNVKTLTKPVPCPVESFKYVSDWLQAYGCQDCLGEFIKNGYDTINKVVYLKPDDLDQVLNNSLLGHRLRLAWSLVMPELESTPDACGSSGRSTRLGSFPCQANEQKQNGQKGVDTSTTFAAHYLGSALIEDATGMEAMKTSMIKLKKATKEITKVPQVTLEINWSGVRVYDSATTRPLCEHPVQNIHCVCQDERDLNCFAYITKDGTRHFCHVFSVLTADIATDLILTLGKAFDAAYQKVIRNSAF